MGQGRKRRNWEGKRDKERERKALRMLVMK